MFHLIFTFIICRHKEVTTQLMKGAISHFCQHCDLSGTIKWKYALSLNEVTYHIDTE